MIVSLAVAAGMTYMLGGLETWRGGAVLVTVPFEDAAGLKTGAEVAIAGVEVGKVTGLAVDHDRAVGTLRLWTPVRADVGVRIRQKSLLGDKYVELVPHSRDAALLVTGDVLPVVGPQTEIDEL